MSARFFPSDKPLGLVTPGYEQAPVDGLIELRPIILTYSVGFTWAVQHNLAPNSPVWCPLDSFKEDLVEYCWIEFTGGTQ